MSNDSPTVVSHPPESVDLDAIERTLSRMWKPPGDEGAGRQAEIRACMSNLIIYCAAPEHACALPEELDTIVRLHPSRVLLLLGEADAATADVAATVTARCHLANSHHHVCSEQITITAGGDSVARLPSVARSLLIGDLPTSLWWAPPTPPTFGGAVFDELQQMADQVIFSSLQWPEPVRGLLATAAWLGDPVAGASAADIAWKRLGPWRSLIGQSLDPRVQPGALRALDRVDIEHGPHGLTQAWLLAGWLASRLGWTPTGALVKRGEEIVWTLHTASGTVAIHVRRRPEGDAGPQNVVIGWQNGAQRASLTFATTSPGRLGMTSQGIDTSPRSLIAPLQSRAELVAGQLHQLERDPIFREALQTARALAESVTG